MNLIDWVSPRRRGAATVQAPCAGFFRRSFSTGRRLGFFSSAVGHWFDRQIGGEILDRLLDPAARFAAYVDQEEVEELLRRRGSYRSHKLLLTVLMLEVWPGQLPPAGRRRSADTRARRPTMGTELTYALVTPLRDEQAPSEKA